MNTGEKRVESKNNLLTGVAWSLGGKTTYSIEGSAFNAGSVIKWLRDEVQLVDSPKRCDELVASDLYKVNISVHSFESGTDEEYLDYVMSKRDQLVMQMLTIGEKEGAIRMDFSHDYITMAIMANLSCLNSCLHLPKAAEYIRQIEQKKDIAYTLLLKSLNH